MNTVLHRVLEGRDERRSLQEHLFGRGISVVVQLALNIPGYPKRMEGDLECLLHFYALFRKVLPGNVSLLSRCLFENGAGLALCTAFSGTDGKELKRLCVFLEEHLSWGRIIDADVLVRKGPLSRREFGFPSRRCLLCEREAKECARLCSHLGSDLRSAARKLLEQACRGGEGAQERFDDVPAESDPAR